MAENEIELLERFIADNDDLLSLEERIGRFNIFDALGLERLEIRHSNFLAWLLTPGESHGLGDIFLKAFLMDLFRKARQRDTSPPVSPVELDGADLRGVDVRREWKNIDLLVTCEEPGFVVAVENKIDSGEHDDQLERYRNTIANDFQLQKRKRLLVFLALKGGRPSDGDWVPYSYKELYGALSRARNVNIASIGADVGVFLNHYLALIGDRFMENEELDKLCRKIYTNHRQALELIWERVPQVSSGLIARLIAWIEERPNDWHFIMSKRTEVHFVPAAWKGMLPSVGRRTERHENWVSALLQATDNQLRFTVKVCPTTDAKTRSLTLLRLLKDPNEFGFFPNRKALTGEWTQLLSENICELSDDDSPEEIEQAMRLVEKRLQEFAEKTTALPAAMKALFAG